VTIPLWSREGFCNCSHSSWRQQSTVDDSYSTWPEIKNDAGCFRLWRIAWGWNGRGRERSWEGWSVLSAATCNYASALMPLVTRLSRTGRCRFFLLHRRNNAVPKFISRCKTEKPRRSEGHYTTRCKLLLVTFALLSVWWCLTFTFA